MTPQYQQMSQPPPDTAASQQPTSTPDAKSSTGSEHLTKASAADIKSGASVYDMDGQIVGKVDSVDSDGAVVNTGTVKAKLSISSFGRNDKGLVINMSRSKFEAAAKAKEQK